MPNVKPGDIAKVIRDYGHESSCSNVGKLVLVEQQFCSPAFTLNAGGVLFLVINGLSWVCKPLQPIWAAGKNGKLTRNFDVVVYPDSCLKRIDPPADVEELWRDTPIKDDPLEVIFEHATQEKS